MSLFQQVGHLFGDLFGDERSTPEATLSGPADVGPFEAVNDAEAYGVQIEPAAVPPGEWYWQAVRVHHLTPEENGGRHHIFMDMLDPTLGTQADRFGARVQNARLKVSWEDGEQVVIIDKPANEPGANIPMWKWQVCSVIALGLPDQELPSDRVVGMHTGHPDEATGNTLFHHSFSVTFVKVRAPDVSYARSVIYGAIRGAAGRTALLIRDGAVVARQPLGPKETFRFTDLPAGTYVVGVEGTNLRSTPHPVDGREKIQLLLTLVLADSVISGQVRNGAGRELLLYRGEREMESQTVGDDETFRFRGLTAGTYRVVLSDHREITSGPVLVDGTDAREISLVAPKPGKPLAHYVLFGPAELPATHANLWLAGDFLLAFKPCFGVTPAEAEAAGMVTIIADTTAVSPEVETDLAADGTPVQRIAGTVDEVAAALSARIAAGQPFG